MPENSSENSKATELPGQVENDLDQKLVVLTGEDLEKHLSKIDPRTGKSIGDTFKEMYGIKPTKFTIIPEGRAKGSGNWGLEGPGTNPLYGFHGGGFGNSDTLGYKNVAHQPFDQNK